MRRSRSSQLARLGWTFVIGLLALGGPLACQTVGRPLEASPATPPLAAMVLPPSFLTPRSRHYRLAVRDFVDQTGKAPGPAYSAGEVLITALHAAGRFDLYDIRGETSRSEAPSAGSREAPVSGAGAGARPETGWDDYGSLQGIVDGVLESYVTGASSGSDGRGRLEIDYRVVDPYTRMVVSTGTARVGLQGGGLVRSDVTRLARTISKPFLSPEALAAHAVEVREVKLDGREVKLTLSAGREQQLRRGFVGFVYEEDRHAGVERYLAKFVIVNVFPNAAVGVVVAHCNAVDRCAEGEPIAAVEQAKNIHVGSRVRFK